MDDDRRRALRERFIERRGYWAPAWEGVLELDPDFFEAYLELAETPRRTGPLEPKVKELILVAINASATHLHRPGVRAHVKNALAAGATPEEIVEVFQIVAVIGIHSCEIGMPILLEAMEEAGLPRPNEELDARQEAIKERFVAERGFWSEAWQAVLGYAPAFFEAYTDLSTAPWREGVLEPKVKELIYVAHSASTTNLHESGVRGHGGLALRHGATREELMEVLELTSLLGVQSINLAVPILIEEAAAFEEAAA
ncbi:MAG: carboxymuconolactone decarboxylase family protein [Solirubrobacterales bacterium]